MTDALTRFLPDEAATLALGRALAVSLQPGMVVYLVGDLGAGKTTLARGVLAGLGHPGKVKSPTFTLVEPYDLSRLYLYHFDFYRFGESHAPDSHELDDAGFRECFDGRSVCLIEWPERAGSRLASPDLTLHLALQGTGRSAAIAAQTEAGRECLERLPP
ncbi:MAG: tRNA (adenosine(37)-N6)-threonylcarbamoyltransferase complex ATPase subunit type 1 TsaE [Burkholderiales bacterium]